MTGEWRCNYLVTGHSVTVCYISAHLQEGINLCPGDFTMSQIRMWCHQPWLLTVL